ncbi:PREDICTED: CMRF35-like molecule 6 [Capra hircus]|uniref:CMRF35-like molecule 6 n=1 Tax=Capra hircus TaxID=9925 RepID=UPI000847CD2D|nr:PREDICTED: CMRF35-like molecule 6 [Capra hircus]
MGVVDTAHPSRSCSMTTTSPKRSTSTPESPTWSTVSGQEAPDPGQAHRLLLGSAHFLLLVFLKVPLLLGMLEQNPAFHGKSDYSLPHAQSNWPSPPSSLHREEAPARHVDPGEAPAARAFGPLVYNRPLCATDAGGCLSLSGPSRVTGIVGGSLSVECQYKEVFINNSKYWCKAPCLLSVEMVETRESEREVRRGRVSIRDRPANLTFTVTLESLREEDAGRYRCGIETSWFEGILRDSTFQIEVFVVPAPATATGPERFTGSPGSPTTLPVPTWSTVSGQETPDPGQPRRPLLGSAHFLLLVFLKVPLLLGMLGAVLCVHRPLRSSADRQSVHL